MYYQITNAGFFETANHHPSSHRTAEPQYSMCTDGGGYELLVRVSAVLEKNARRVAFCDTPGRRTLVSP